MRQELKKLSGTRIKIVAAVDRFGKKKAYRGLPLDTICLINLTDINGHIICDHLWLVVGKQIKALNLSSGDKISFTARAKKYTKGYRGHKEDVYKPIETDYKLANPTGFCKLNTIPLDHELPGLFNQSL